jgi:hypothetical protein
MNHRVNFNSQSSCFCLLSVGITYVMTDSGQGELADGIVVMLVILGIFFLGYL